MKKLYSLAMAFLATLSMATFVSCENAEIPEDPTPENQPVIEIEDVIEVAIDGGAKIINYTITNPVEGAHLSASTDASWISNLSTQVDGIITFMTTTNNTNEIREAVVELVYASANKSVIIRQLASGIMVEYGFEASISEQSYHYCKIDLIPESAELSYIMDIFLVEDLEEIDVDTDEEIYNYLYEYSDYIGSMSGMTGGQVLAMNAKQGIKKDVKLSGLKPDTKCLFVAFYFDTDACERISDVFRYEFTTLAAEVGEMDFEYAFEIDGPVATATVTPANNDVHYYFDVMPRNVLEEVCAEEGVDKEKYIMNWWTEAVYNDMLNDATAGHILDTQCSKGVDSFTFELLADTEYYIFAFGVNDFAVCNTTPNFEVFKTGAVDSSSLSFQFTVSDLTKCGVKIAIDASNDTDPYVAGLLTAEEWNDYGSTSAERLPKILERYDFPDAGYGDSVFEEQKQLTPDTEYVFFTFGYFGGVATTMLYSVEFKTLEDIPSKETISVKDLGYYDIWDINMYDETFGYLGMDDDDFAVMPVEFETSTDDLLIYFYTWAVDPYFDLDWVTDANRFGRYLYWAPRKNYMWTIVAYNTDAWVGAMGRDSEGYYTNEYLDKRPITRNGVGDAEEFIEWYNSHDVIADPSKYIDELYGENAEN